MNKRWVVAVAFTVFPAVLANNRALGQSPESQVAAVRDSWVTDWNADQFDALAELYSEDAALLPPTGLRVAGREAIGNFFRDAKSSSGQRSLRLMPARTRVVGALAYEDGQYSAMAGGGRVKMSGHVRISGRVELGGGGQEVKGSYLVVLTRSGGKWFLVEHSFTEARPTSPAH
jgi:uncharacterized protein (TIGR02246 family)